MMKANWAYDQLQGADAMVAARDPLTPDISVPLYLDEPAMLDLLASIDDGFTTVERIVTRAADKTDKEGSVSGDLASANWFSGMLKIGFSGAGKASRGQSHEQEREGERFHTPGSLLHRLRTLLLQRSLLTRPEGNQSDWESIRVSDFVEFRGSITPNPFGHALKTIINSAKFLAKLPPQSTTQSAVAGTGGSRPAQPKKSTQLKDDPFLKTLEILLGDLEQEETQTLLITPSGSARSIHYSAVATIATSHLIRNSGVD